MKIRFILPFVTALILLLAMPSVWAKTYIQQIGYDAPDGDRITGFIYQSVNTPKNAPIAVLIHGLTGSSLFWLAKDNVAYGDAVTAMLIDRGFRVIALDARAHGGRRDHLAPIARVKAARAGDVEAYTAMINDTLADYRFLLNKITTKYTDSERIVVIGYSMGGQIGTMLAASDDRVTHLVTMVPPAVRNVPSVAPITHAPNISVPWLLLTAEQDPFSTTEQNAELISVAGKRITNISFKSGHMLPSEYVTAIGTWLEKQ